MKMKNKSTQVLFHVIGCTIFLLLPIIFWPGEGGIGEFFSDDRAVRGYLNNILILLFFYLNYYLFIPKLFFQKKFLYFILIILLCYFIIAFLPEIILPFQGHSHQPPGPGPGPGPEPGHRPGFGGPRILFRMFHNLVFFLAVVFFSLLLKINNRLKQMEREKLRAELSYFKAQINPHFLFNTLNSIYSLAIQKDDKTPEAVVKLSGMMRYVMTDASHDFVPLDKEISYITDYIDLQKIRFGDTARIDYQPCVPAPGKYIAPLILIPFIENAFKFGVNPESDSFISVRINMSGSKLQMSVFNHKIQKRTESEPAGGLGISNAKQRLAMLYPEKHRLVIEDGNSHYKVDLYINLP
jgi:hypothetical protein